MLELLRAIWNLILEFLRGLQAPPPMPIPDPGDITVIDSPKYGILKLVGIENGLTLQGRFTPAVVQLNDHPVPDGRKGMDIPVLPSAWEYIRAINDDRGYDYARSVHKMWINKDYADGETPMAVSISSMCNFVAWEVEEDRCVKLLCFPNSEDFSKHDPQKVNWHTRPDLFWKAGATNLAGDKLTNVGDDIDCFIPLMARATNNGTGELWLAKNEIEPFPSLPLEVIVAAERGVLVRSNPGTASDVVGGYLKDQAVTILQYRPLGAAVWGRTENGWIALLYGGQFLTDWKLNTRTVIPPG